MVASADSLKQSLAQVKSALDAAEAIDPETEQALRETLDAIEARLAEVGGKTEPTEAADRLTAGAYRLEASHPDLSLALHEIAEMLSRLGI